MFDMGCGLRLLWRCAPDHPLCAVFDVGTPKGASVQMRWLFAWDDIHSAHEQLKKYEETMWKAIEDHENNPGLERTPSRESVLPSEDPVEYGLFETKEAAEEMLSKTMQNMSLSSA